MGWLDRVFDTSKPIDQARLAANDVVSRIEPIALSIEHRAAGILHGLLTRLNGTEITIKINIPPQPYPGPDAEIQKGQKV